MGSVSRKCHSAHGRGLMMGSVSKKCHSAHGRGLMMGSVSKKCHSAHGDEVEVMIIPKFERHPLSFLRNLYTGSVFC